MRFAALLFILAALCAAAPVSAEIQINKIVGKETPGGDYKHPACIAELANGDLYLAWYGGQGEYEGDTKVWSMRLRKGETNWQGPWIIADTPNRGDGNPVVWQAPDGLVWLFWVVRYGETWSESRIMAKISKDGAQSWNTDAFPVAYELGMMVRCKPVDMGGGEFLLPIYHETGHDREIVGADTTSLFLRYDPTKNIFTETNRIASRIGNLQPSAVAITKDYLVSYSRRGGGYENVKDGYIVRSESKDGGRTWSPGTETKIPNPNSAVDLLKLQNGHILLVYNEDMNNRTPLTVAISTDNEQTWQYKKNLLAGNDDYAYPYAIQTKDGKIHIVFTQEIRTVVMHAVFDEDDIVKPAKAAKKKK